MPLLGQLIQTASLELGTPIPSTSECPEYPIVCVLVTATSVLRQEWEQVKPTWTLHGLYSPSLFTQTSTMSTGFSKESMAEAEAAIQKSEAYQAREGEELLNTLGMYLDVLSTVNINPLT